jgi:hypothetical protein
MPTDIEALSGVDATDFARVAQQAVGYQAINVKAYGATGDGVADDTAEIQAAIDAAYAIGDTSDGTYFGSIIFFPPGVYLVTDTLLFNAGNANISIIGSGRRCTKIIGGFAGYIIDKPDDNAQALDLISDITIKNSSIDQRSGAIRLCTSNGAVIERCRIEGFIGIDNSGNAFCTSIRNCELTTGQTTPPPGSVGIFATQTGIYNTRITNYDHAVRSFNAGQFISGSAAEVCNQGLILGYSAGASFTGSITNDELTVTEMFRFKSTDGDWPALDGSNIGDNIRVGTALYGTGVPNGTVISSLGTGVGATGTYNLSSSGLTLAERGFSVTGVADVLQGVSVQGFQTERCLVAVALYSVTAANVSGCVLTGSQGPPNEIVSSSYSAPNLEVTTNDYALVDQINGGVMSSPQTFYLVDWQASGTAIPNGNYTCTIVDHNTFTFNPGGNPGTIGGSKNWSRLPQYALRTRAISNSHISSIIPTVASEVADIDLSWDGNTTSTVPGAVVLSGIGAGATWIMPPSNHKSAFKYIQCAGTGFSDVLTFNELPGQAGSTYVTAAVEGMEFNISNCGTTTFAATANGSGSENVKVRYNGSTWTVAGA